MNKEKKHLKDDEVLKANEIKAHAIKECFKRLRDIYRYSNHVRKSFDDLEREMLGELEEDID